MGNVHTFTSHIRAVYGCLDAALGGESGDVKVTTFVNMKNYDMIAVQGIASEVASGKIITLRLWEATATDGSGSQSMTHASASDTFTSTNTTDTDILICQARGEDLSSGYTHIGAKISTNQTDGTEVVGVIINQMRARYKQASLPA